MNITSLEELKKFLNDEWNSIPIKFGQKFMCKLFGKNKKKYHSFRVLSPTWKIILGGFNTCKKNSMN